jgi:hypothetical protein
VSFCTRCGHPVDGTRPFCTNCGARLRAADSEDTAVPPSPRPEWPEQPPLPPERPPLPRERPVRPEPPTLTAGIPPAPAADPYPGAEPPEPSRRRIPAWGIIAAAVVVVLAGLGGWYAATRHGGTPAASAQKPPAARASAGGAGSPAATAPTSPLASPAGSPASSTPAGSPEPSTPGGTAAGGGSQVALGPGVSGQTAGSVAAFAGQYFAAINSHDYPAYISLFAPGADPGEDAQKFQAGYASTTDSSETLVALAGTASGKTAASLTFDSHQAPASSATHTACTSWRITLYLVQSGTSYLISHPPAGYHASFQPCP